MHEDILKQVAQKIDRRNFLRGSGVTFAALVGMAAASPTVTIAESPAKEEDAAREPRRGDRVA